MSEQVNQASAGLLLVHGEEAGLIDEAVARWRAGLPEGDVEVFDAPATLQPLIASLVDMPLFGDHRAVLVRNLALFTGARKGGDVEPLVRALAVRAPTTTVCFAVRATVPPSNPLLAAIRGGGGAVVHHPALRAGDRRQWLEAALRNRGLNLPAGGADLVMRCTGGDLPTMAAELDKIVAHGPLTLDQLALLLAGTEQLQIYAVLHSLAGAEPARGAALLAGLLDEGRSVQYLLAILAGQLRDLLMAHALLIRGQRGAGALAAAAKMPPWRAEKVVRQAQLIPAGLATTWLHDLQRIDAGLKAGELEDGPALRTWGLAAADALRSWRARHTPVPAGRTNR